MYVAGDIGTHGHLDISEYERLPGDILDISLYEQLPGDIGTSGHLFAWVPQLLQVPPEWVLVEMGTLLEPPKILL